MNRKSLIYLLIPLLFISCMSVRRAEKVFDRNPQAAARYAMTRYPTRDSVIIKITTPDSSEIKEAIDSAVSIQDSLCRVYADEMNRFIAKIQQELNEKYTDSTAAPYVKEYLDSIKKAYKSKVKKATEQLAKQVPPQIVEKEVWRESPRTRYFEEEARKQTSLKEEALAKLEKQKRKTNKWRMIAIISIIINLALLTFIFRKTIFRFTKGLILRLMGIPKIPPI